MATTHWTVPPDHPAFAGHFPGHPILPGVVLLDAVIRHATASFARDPAALRLASAKFLSVVSPGETLAIALAEKANGSLQFAIHCGERPVASGTLATRTEDA